jgi:cyclopentanol dehydrogenase
VASEADWQRVIPAACAAYGNVNVLVNNAGIGLYKATVDTTLAEWDTVQNINARGTFIGCREIIPVMSAAGGGSIINVSSSYGLVGRAGFAAYGASKGAVRVLSKALAAELAGQNIRVNSLHPGTIDTNLTKMVLSTPESAAAIFGPQLIRRAGLPVEVAHAVLYLASDESSFVTGTELTVDGGYVAV